MITLKQLAEISGLSVRTVGRALSGHPYVSEEKRKLVLELAARYHYIPNMAARNLRLNQKHFVGILFDNYSLSPDSRMLNLLNLKLVENSFWPLIGNTGTGEDCLPMLREWAAIAEYVIVLHESRVPVLKKLIASVESLPLRCIYADCALHSGDYHFSTDRTGSVKQLVLEAERMGFRHLVYCGSLDTRRQGIDAAGKELSRMKISYVKGRLEFEDAYRLGDAVMQSGADIVFFDTDRMAMGFYRYAAERKIIIPDQIAVAGFDGEPFAGYLTPPLATLAHPHEEFVELILEIIKSGNIPEVAPIPMKFLKRESFRKVAAAAL